MPSTADTNRPTDHPLMGHEDKPEGSFLQRLSADDWRFLLEDDLRGRSFGQDEHLPMAQDDRNVYMIWDGVVDRTASRSATGTAPPPSPGSGAAANWSARPSSSAPSPPSAPGA